MPDGGNPFFVILETNQPPYSVRVEDIMVVEYKSDDWNQQYDIVNHPEMFRLYVDGEQVDSE